MSGFELLEATIGKRRRRVELEEGTQAHPWTMEYGSIDPTARAVTRRGSMHAARWGLLVAAFRHLSGLIIALSDASSHAKTKSWKVTVGGICQGLAVQGVDEVEIDWKPPHPRAPVIGSKSTSRPRPANDKCQARVGARAPREGACRKISDPTPQWPPASSRTPTPEWGCSGI